MRRILILSAVMWFSATLPAQRNGSTTLVVRVQPETLLNPRQVQLAFRVSADGSEDLVNQATAFDAWVRAFPGQRIRVLASVGSLTGPEGVLPTSAVAWSGSVVRASGGGQQSSCTSGSFNGSPQDLVSNWQRSGTVACTVTFSLSSPRTLAPGTYTGTVALAVRTE